MNIRVISYPLLLLILLFTTGAMAQQGGWNKIRDKGGIEVFNRTNENSSFKEFRSKMVIEGKLNTFLAVLYDVKGLPSWGYKVREASLISRDSDSLQVYYAVAKAPFPYKNRDGVYLNRFVWDSSSRTLTVEIELIEDQVDEKEEFVRMKGYGFWKVLELPENRLEIHFQMQMDPGGNIPAWLSNMFSGDTPYFTLLELRKAMSDKKYQGKEHALIK